MAMAVTLSIAPVATATAAVAAAPTTVTADQCFNNGGFFGGYNSAARAYCSGGIYNGIPFDKDPGQGWCLNGYHLVFRYLEGLFCVPDLPNTPG
ncbi:hypothetical protein [Streptacidiphilus sp. MAP12-16]|uniref:hypothetical protein n=1 Tax=Streptacidiphilus sp. MAP12-16 TaxID=3156300 RepID=UPI0035174D42